MIVPPLYHQSLGRITAEHPLIGMALLRHRNARREPMSFKTRPYLVEWYVDFDSATEVEGADISTVPQVGKAQPIDEPVLTPAGWKPIGDLRVGDSVISVDGKPTKVVGVFPQGLREIARVTLDDGTAVRCDFDHLWSVQSKTDRLRGRPWRTMTTREIAESTINADGRRWHLPVVAPVEHPDKDLPVDPYVLGVLIGDGNLTNSVPRFVTADAFVAAEVARVVGALGGGADDGVPGEYRILGGRRGRSGSPNPTKIALEALGIWGSRAWEKHIPADYLIAGVEQRIGLLQGLMDTDGHVRPSDGRLEYTTTSDRLSSDLSSLVRSLGGTVQVRSKIPTYRYRGEHREGRRAYTVRILLPPELQQRACRLPRKRDQIRTMRRTVARTIESVEQAGVAECVCIMVDHPTQLYVTRGHAVTHNSEFFNQFILHEAGWRGRLTAYAMPTASLRDEFVKRINPLLIEVPAYRERLPAVDAAQLQKATDTGSMRSKRFGRGTMLFVSAKTGPDWVDYSVDTFVIDEYDPCLLESRINIGKAADRLRASSRPRRYNIGNPDMPRAGIEGLWEAGDQRLFHWRCSHCGERQPIQWLENVVDRDDAGNWVIRDPEARKDPTREIRPVCRRCHRPFERDPMTACWIPLCPERTRRSYRVARYDDLGASLRVAWFEWLLAQPSTELTRLWWRGWEGIAFESASGGVARTDLQDAAILPPMPADGDSSLAGRAVTAGIDVGSLFHITVTQAARGAAGRAERRGLWVGTVRTPEQVHDVLRRFHVRTAVIDWGPETRISQEIRDYAREHYSCDVWLCRFSPADRAGAEEFGMRLDVHDRIAVVDRTQLLDAASDHVRLGGKAGRQYRAAGVTEPPAIDDRRKPVEQAATWAALEEVPDPGGERARLWPADVIDVAGFCDQMVAPRRVYTAEGTVRWSEGGRPDHYRLADSYDLLAYVIDGQGGVLL
jgi:hypothetical protein